MSLPRRVLRYYRPAIRTDVTLLGNLVRLNHRRLEVPTDVSCPILSSSSASSSSSPPSLSSSSSSSSTSSFLFVRWRSGYVLDWRWTGRGLASRCRSASCRLRPWASRSQTCAVTKQYNLAPSAKQLWRPAVGEVIIGLASHWPSVIDI